MQQQTLNEEVPATQPVIRLRRDPITGRLICEPCWNGIHFIYEKKWNKKEKKYVKTKKRACFHGCECLCALCW